MSDQSFLTGNLSKPYLFMVEMPKITNNNALITSFIRETSMPGLGENEEKPKSWKIVLINDEKQELRILFLNWLQEQSKSYDTKIHQLTNGGEIIHTCKFNGLFPIGVSSIKFEQGELGPQYFSVYFSYDNVQMDFNLPQLCPWERDLKESQETNKETPNV